MSQLQDYPLRAARTHRFTAGQPRNVTVAGPVGGRQVLFLRSEHGEDPVNHLWMIDPVTGQERCIVDVRSLAADDAELPAAERARRERVREQGGGITAFSVDRAGATVVFALGGRLHVVDVATGTTRPVALDVAVFDPRIAPDGRHVALHIEDGVSLVDLTSEPPVLRRLIEEPGVVWGRAEFIAAEEMGRTAGMWWSPDGCSLAVARVDESPVQRVRVADPSQPEQPPVELAHPMAGTPNALVTLGVIDIATGRCERIDLVAAVGDDAEYLARVAWDVEPLLVGVQPRDQSALHVLAFDGAPRSVRSVRRIEAAPWVELVPGSPTWLGSSLVSVEDVADEDGPLRRALCLDGVPITPPGLQVRAITGVLRQDGSVAPDGPSAQDREASVGGTILLSVSAEDPTSVLTMPVRIDGAQVLIGPPTADGPGLHHATAVGDASGRPELWVHRTSDLDHDGPRLEVELVGHGRHPIRSVALAPGFAVRPRLLELGPDRLRAALLLPSDLGPEDTVPVVLDPYGGPHAQRVLSARAAFTASQWLAEQGFAVLVVDGRGTPGRGPAFEHAIHLDLAGPALEDQLVALDAAAALEPRLDLTRVGIRGWSYGGTLAALAAVRRPDRIRAAVVGAPVTDWHRYDTHYTERYLGLPTERPEAYARSGVVDPDGGLRSVGEGSPAPLLIIHGLADDNVFATHSFMLTESLLAAGHPFQFLPLTRATHMASDPVIAARLLQAEVTFLRDALGVPTAR